MKRLGLTCLILVAAGLMSSVAAEAGSLQWHSYAAKFVCGNVERGPFSFAVDGKYKTTVNIHNPHYLLDGAGAPIPAQFFKKIVLTPHQAEPRVPPSCFLEELLDADHGLSVNCGNIQRQLALSGLPSTFPLEGFVVLLVPPFQGVGESLPPELDVTVIHTARSRAPQTVIRTNGVSTWDVETVAPRDVRGDPVLSFCD